MKYCENCHIITEDEICPLCGRKKLGEVKDEDFCLLGELEDLKAKMFYGILESEKIKAAIIPQKGSYMTMAVMFTVEIYKIYVPYKDLNRAKELFEDFK